MAAPNFNDAYKYVVSVVVSIVSSKCQLIFQLLLKKDILMVVISCCKMRGQLVIGMYLLS